MLGGAAHSPFETYDKICGCMLPAEEDGDYESALHFPEVELIGEFVWAKGMAMVCCV